MRRREALGIIGGCAVWLFSAGAQQVDRMRRVGVLMASAAEDSESTGPHHRIHAPGTGLDRRSSITVGVHGPEVEVGIWPTSREQQRLAVIGGTRWV